MQGLFIMLPIALSIAVLFLVLFLWSLRNGDYEDSEMSRYKMLFDEDEGVDYSMTPVKSTVEKTN